MAREKRIIVRAGIAMVLCLVLAGAASADLSDGLVAHWEFEGDFVDSAGSNDATPEGEAQIVTDAERGSVVELDGSGDYLEIANSPSLNITSDQITLAAWVYFDDVSGDPEIIIAKVFNNTTHQSPYFSYGLHILTNGQPRMWISRTGGAANAPGTTNLQSARWYHLAGVYDGSQMRLYLDGVLVAGNNVSGNLVGYDTVLRLGINGGRTEPMDGKLDDVRIYNRALSEREVVSLATGISLYNAWKPVPADGDLAVATPLLQWSPGETAVFHDVYLGTDPNLGPDDLVQAHNPMTLYYHGPGLVPGTTYYWRVDEIEVDGTTVHTGEVWTFMAMPVAAWAPSPADGATGAFQAPTLSWSPGKGALGHHVYFGSEMDAVGEGAAETDQGPVAEAAFHPGLLRAGTTYYWRVDETDLAGQAREGQVWSFTTGQPAEGRVVHEWWLGISGTAVSALTGHPRYPGSPDGVEFVGLFEGPVNWADNYASRLYGWLIPPQSGQYTFWIASDDNSQLWLSTDADPAKAVEIADVPGWTPSRDFDNTGGGAGGPSQQSAPISLQAGQKYYIEAVMKEGTGGDNIAVAWQPPGGTREVIPGGFVNTFALPPLKAAAPSPLDGAVDVVQPLVLGWFAGENATQHDVYFGDDVEALASADTASPEYRGQQVATSYNPGALEWGKTYCWRIDEKQADGTVLKGAVWSFTTATFVVVEDFESYDDADNRIYLTWIDGADNGTGSYVGYPVANNGTFGETVIVHSGGQSMPLEYDNANAPFYSETERTFDTPQDWTVNGVDALVLYVRGSGSNDAEPLYVGIEDSSGNLHVVVHPDPAIATVGAWGEWRTPLSEFSGAGVNLTAVKEMYIGLGDRSAATPGGAGLIFIDDIRVVRP